MPDVDLRELERRAAGGGRGDVLRLNMALLRAGRRRDPRLHPRVGDRLRVPCHGMRTERWDERRVASCGEALVWSEPPQGMEDVNWHRYCWSDRSEGGVCLDAVHWARSDESYRQLKRWGLARDRHGTMQELGSWRRWARDAEILEWGPDDGQ